MTAIQTWWQVVFTFLKLSLFSIGGGNTLLQAYHHEAVETFGWLTNRQFSDLYGLAEAAPGPSSRAAATTRFADARAARRLS